MKYTDNNSFAIQPGMIQISDDKWIQIKNIMKLGYFKSKRMERNRERVQEYIKLGDTNPAIVVSGMPLKVAAYSKDLDAVLILKFDNRLAKEYNLQAGTRLISVNVYNRVKAADVFPEKSNSWSNFIPTIGDFLSDDNETIAFHKIMIDERVWARTHELAKEYIAHRPNFSRRGFWFI